MNDSFMDGLSAIFADALMEIVSKTSGISLNAVSSAQDWDFYEIAGLMHMNGKNSGTIFVSANEASMRVLCSCVMGIPQSDISKDDIDDAMCELVNMTAGNAKLRLGNFDYTFTLTTPFAVSGENMSIVTKKRTRIISKSLASDEISIKLKVIYEPGM